LEDDDDDDDVRVFFSTATTTSFGGIALVVVAVVVAVVVVIEVRGTMGNVIVVAEEISSSHIPSIVVSIAVSLVMLFSYVRQIFVATIGDVIFCWYL
jgi:hypothetical protein